MQARLQSLHAHLVEVETEQQSAQLSALQAQIKPHFLYNTLASIRFLVYTGQTDRADAALLSLVAFLRAMANTQTTTLKDEFATLSAYIDLQKLALSAPLSVTMTLPITLEHIPVCPFLLQPLVENAFMHGFSTKQPQCTLRVHAEQKENTICLIVQDNGIGNPATTVHTGQGLVNLHKRLCFFFGASATLTITHPQEGGTVATITFPYETKGEDAP